MAWWEDEPEGIRGPVRWFVVVPVAATIALGLQLTYAPLRLRWLVNRPAFEAVVEQAQRGEPIVNQPGHIGGYRIMFVRRVGDRHHAEDLTADVFREALAGIRKFEWRGVPFAAWLVGIASHSVKPTPVTALTSWSRV